VFLRRMNRLSMEMSQTGAAGGEPQGAQEDAAGDEAAVKVAAAHARTAPGTYWRSVGRRRISAGASAADPGSDGHDSGAVAVCAEGRRTSGSSAERQVTNEEKILSLSKGMRRCMCGARREPRWNSLAVAAAEAECGLADGLGVGVRNPEHDTVLLKRSLGGRSAEGKDGGGGRGSTAECRASCWRAAGS